MKTNSKAWIDFIEGIAAKVKKYAQYLTALISLVQALQNIFSNLPKIGFLNLTPQAGGIDNFMNRVKNAQIPVSGEGLTLGKIHIKGAEVVQGSSGPTGITAGVVFVYGAPLGADAFGKIGDDISKDLQPIYDSLKITLETTLNGLEILVADHKLTQAEAESRSRALKEKFNADINKLKYQVQIGIITTAFGILKKLFT